MVSELQVRILPNVLQYEYQSFLLYFYENDWYYMVTSWYFFETQRDVIKSLKTDDILSKQSVVGLLKRWRFESQW